jgi:hypothetical protein
MLFTAPPGPIVAVLVVPYIALAVRYWSVTDDASESANRGWRRFIWINYSVGFLVTLALIDYGVRRG